LTLLIETHYLPCLAFFAVVRKAQAVKLEKNEYFVKQTYRNRCYINTEHGPDSLHIPVTSKHGKVIIADVRIDNTQKWLNNHWRSIRSAYGKAPFFEHYADDLHAALCRKHEFLYDLNYELLTMCLKWLKLTMPVMETLTYEKNPGDQIMDGRGLINLKNTGKLGEVYKPVSYTQVFGNAFVANLSLLDLIFCCGPEAGRIVQASSV
jgi:hypothetical protein